MRNFITGATGFIGSHLVQVLVDNGEEVVGLTRSRSNAAHLPAAVEVVEGDITDPASIREAMAGVDRVFHTAGWVRIGPGPRLAETAERVNVAGTRNVLELVEELGVSKCVYTSTIGVYPPSRNGQITEGHPPECPDLSVYNRTKWQAHYQVARPMAAAGLPLVTVLPGSVYGPGDKPDSPVRLLFRAYLGGDLPLIPREFYAPWEHVADIAHAHHLAMEHGRPGEEYIIAGEPRTLVEVLRCAEAITGIPVPRTVPAGVFRLLSRVMAGVERIVTPPPGYEAESLRTFANTRWPVDNAKATTELGIEHRPLKDGLREYLEWELQQREQAPSP